VVYENIAENKMLHPRIWVGLFILCGAILAEVT